MGCLCPITIYGSPVTLLKFQMVAKLVLFMSSGSKKKDPRCTCLSEAKASHSQRMWAKVSSSAAHLLHSGLSSSPSRWRCLPQGVIGREKAINSPGLGPVTVQKPGFGTQHQVCSLELSWLPESESLLYIVTERVFFVHKFVPTHPPTTHTHTHTHTHPPTHTPPHTHAPSVVG
jgi:hypothetical protein